MWSSPESCGTICVVVRRACESTHFRRSRLNVRAWGGVLGALLVLSALAGCRAKPRPSAGTASSLAGAGSVARGPKLAPLTAGAWLIDLDVDGFGKAALAVPLGATEARSIVIALHGPADRPEWACGAWRGIVGPAPFVLCPRGVQRADFAAPDARYTFGSADATAQELRAGLAALKHKFAAYVAPGSVVFTGFEVGADRAALIARQEPTFFARLALVDPGSDTWPSSQAAEFGREGGERMLLACGPAGRAGADLKAVLTRRGGADARAVFLGDRPPALDAASVARLAAEWPWLSAPTTRLAPAEDLIGNPVAAKRPALPKIP
jgi:hypothetical protein